jgi:Uma2 family endonuclease
MGMPAIRRRWTPADVRALMDAQRGWPRYELIDGELIVTPAPAPVHQFAIALLLRTLYDYVGEQGIGIAVTSPADLELRPGTIVQPDVFVMPMSPRPRDGTIMTWSEVRSLVLAVEVISPSSVRTDRVVKRDFYLTVPVAEYWCVDLDARMIERWFPERETPVVTRGTLEWLPAGARDALTVDLTALFASVWAQARGQ